MTNKTKKELVNELEDQQLKKFREAIEEVEKMHGYKVVPIIEYRAQAIIPTLIAQKIKEENKTE